MLEKYYLSINEFPLFNWFRCNEEQYKYCRRDPNVGTEKEDLQAWENLYNDFIQKVGFSDEFNLYLDNLKARAKSCLEFLESLKEGKRNIFLINRIRMLTIKIDMFESKLTGNENNEIKMLNAISKYQGYRIPQKEITVLEYEELKKQFVNSLKEN